MTSKEIVQFSPPPQPWTSNFKRIPLLQITISQLKENIILGWLLYFIRSFLQVGFSFQYQLINPVWLSIDFFHLAKANLVPRAILKNEKPLFCLPFIMKRCAGVKVELSPHYLLFCGFTFLCEVVQQYFF